MPIDPRRLLTFREVARRRSFSRAAEALSLTQSAVSQQVAALERQLGTRLLDRRPGGPVSRAGAPDARTEPCGGGGGTACLTPGALSQTPPPPRREHQDTRRH